MNSTPENLETASAKGKFQLHKRLQHKVGEAIADFTLLQEGDRVLIGLSGGKDSLALLDLLGERQQRARDAWQLHALHVRMRNIHYRTDTAYLAERCAAWGIPLHVVEAGFEPDRNARRTPCFLCSWNRRKVLFQQAQALGCNKIALGHHQDDILRTALMNLTFNGSFATMPGLLTPASCHDQRPLASNTMVRETYMTITKSSLYRKMRIICKDCFSISKLLLGLKI